MAIVEGGRNTVVCSWRAASGIEGRERHLVVLSAELDGKERPTASSKMANTSNLSNSIVDV